MSWNWYNFYLVGYSEAFAGLWAAVTLSPVYLVHRFIHRLIRGKG